MVLVLGTLLAAGLALRRDRLGPWPACAGHPWPRLLVELAIKPLVGRHFDGVLSYPSGNVTDVAAVATALALATCTAGSGPWSASSGLVATGAMAVAVTGLRWHFPTDALGGAVFGVGIVLLVDGVLHLPELARWLPPVLGRGPTPSDRSRGG